MTLSPAPRSTAADGLRLLACWLAVILLMQGFQGALNLGTGPLHTHDAVAARAQAHRHDGFERHYHALTDLSVRAVDAPDDAFDAVAFALAAALALMALGIACHTACTRRHVLRAAAAWFRLDVLLPPRLRPPRAG